MSPRRRRFGALLALLLLTPLYAADISERPLTVTIDYGAERPSRTVTTAYRPGTTALELLRRVAAVQTYTLGAYRFIRSVDGIAGKPGGMGWFYSIDGVPAKTTAEKRQLLDAAAMTWRFKPALCY